VKGLGGAAVHYWTEGKVTQDIDAAFGSRLPPVPLRIPYVDEQGLVWSRPLTNNAAEDRTS